MKAVTIKLGGREYYLVFNGSAMFAVEEVFGGASQMIDTIREEGSKAFDSLCKAMVILAEQGELVRRFMGYETQPMLTEESLKIVAAPLDIALMKQAVTRAVIVGFGREIEDDTETDLGLIELNQKKTGK